MPLDGHSYLVAQGWEGQGKALREGAISRPLIVAQKKTLSGVGKDRDEAFPFWDHVFAAAANAIQVKIQDGDDDTDTPQPSGSTTPLDRTVTGIISNRPRKMGAPALSGSATPETMRSGLSIMALAKREAARRGLYAMFFRGPVLGPDDEEEAILKATEVIFKSQDATPSENKKKRKLDETKDERKQRKMLKAGKAAVREEKKKKRELKMVEEEKEGRSGKKSKGKDISADGESIQPAAPGVHPLATATQDVPTAESAPSKKKRKREGDSKESKEGKKKKTRKRSEKTT